MVFKVLISFISKLVAKSYKTCYNILAINYYGFLLTMAGGEIE